MEDWYADATAVLVGHLEAVASKDVQQLRLFFHPEALFFGTDDSERWTTDDLAKLLVESEAGWDMRECLKREVRYISPACVSFFEVVRHLKYGLFRGSGIVVKDDEGQWMIRHYVLSYSVPNKLADKPLFAKLLALKKWETA